MGDSTSWIAVEGASASAVHKALGATWSTQLEGGWILALRGMVANGVVADEKLLKKLPHAWRIVAGDAETHVMYSAACEWREGREVWAIVHDGQEGTDDLVVRGEPPAGWKKTRDTLLAKGKQRAGVDYAYEVAPEVAKLIVGFRVDE